MHRANVEDLTGKGESLTLLVRGKARGRVANLRSDMARRLKKYLALRGVVERDKVGTPLFCACQARGGKRSSRRRVRVPMDGHRLVAGWKRPGISPPALRHLHTGDLRAVHDLLGLAGPRTMARSVPVVDRT